MSGWGFALAEGSAPTYRAFEAASPNFLQRRDPFPHALSSLVCPQQKARRRRPEMAGMVVIYKQPADAEAFDKHYFETHLPLAKKLPGLRKYEISHGPITVLAGPPDVYLIGAVHFDDLEAMQKAFASPEGRAAAADRQLYAPDDSGVQMFVFDTREV
jgi:uncharacterized protein (TIGR02118 family)